MSVKADLSFLILFIILHPDLSESRVAPKVEAANPRPIIGIVSQEPPPSLSKQHRYALSYIPASYVKYVEAAGARVVPILIQKDDSYYEKLFKSINGILIPGGGANVSNSGYADVSKKLYKLAVQANDNKDYFPIWATCLGFEMLAIMMAKDQSYCLVNCSANDIALPLNLSQDVLHSKLFDGIPDNVYSTLQRKASTANFHHKCLTQENVNKYELDKSIHILSTNKDENGLDFISTFEALYYPFYGVQWHPEKVSYEWTTKEKSIPHDYESIEAAQYFANFFVKEARKSLHKYEDEEMEKKALIYRYNPVYTGLNNSTFQQCYFFKNNTDGRF